MGWIFLVIPILIIWGWFAHNQCISPREVAKYKYNEALEQAQLLEAWTHRQITWATYNLQLAYEQAKAEIANI